MARLQFKGLDTYIAQLEKAADKTTGLMKRAVFDGAAQVANAAHAQVAALPVVDEYTPPSKLPIRGIRQEQKQGLLAGLGLAKMRDDGGYINTHIGFDGYNSFGQPNSMIARSINSGSSTRAKIPFMQRAISASKGAAEGAMAARFDADIKSIIK